MCGTQVSCLTLLHGSEGQSLGSLSQTAPAFISFPILPFERQQITTPTPPPRHPNTHTLGLLWGVFIKSHKSKGHVGVHATVTYLFSHQEEGERGQENTADCQSVRVEEVGTTEVLHYDISEGVEEKKKK